MVALTELTAYELTEKILAKETSFREITRSFSKAITDRDPKIGAFLIQNRSADKESEQLDREIQSNPKEFFRQHGPLAGLPIAVKDNMCTTDFPTTCASKILQNYTPAYNATVVEKLRTARMPILGKTNLDEFAMGSSTENSAFQKTRNPWNIQCVPGGSSGGSAAAVTACEAPLALGSDTGGSIRQPASFCGIVGLKPTYGLVSRYGLVAFASSLDQIGPLTRDVRDAALLLSHIAGHDPRDSTSAPVDMPDYSLSLKQDIKGLRIGLVQELMGKGIDPEVKKAVQESAKVFERLGGVVEETSLPTLTYALSVYYLVATAEASSNLARFDGVRYGTRAKDVDDILTMYTKTRAEGFGPEVKRRIMLGTYALSAGYYDAYYLKAQKIRTLIKQDFEKAFSKYSVLIMPTSPTVAFQFGEKTDDPLTMYLSDIATIPVNLAGIPGISLPCGMQNGLPIGLQILAKHFDEPTLLRASYAYEQATSWHKQRAKV